MPDGPRSGVDRSIATYRLVSPRSLVACLPRGVTGPGDDVHTVMTSDHGMSHAPARIAGSRQAGKVLAGWTAKCEEGDEA